MDELKNLPVPPPNPREMLRKAFAPQRPLVQADYRSLELQILAYLGPDFVKEVYGRPRP